MGRKRRHEVLEQVVVSSEEDSLDEDEKEQPERKRHHRSKKSKKEKRSRRSKHSKKHRHRSPSETPEDEEVSTKRRKKMDPSPVEDDTVDGDASTDQEGGQTPTRDTKTVANSDIEDGEISEENENSRKLKINEKSHRKSRSNLHNRYSDVAKESDESENEEQKDEGRPRRKEKANKSKQIPEQERNNYSPRHKDRRRTRRNHHRSSSGEEHDKDNERSENDSYHNGHHRYKMEDEDEALPGDIPYDPKKSSFGKKQDTTPEKDALPSSSKETSLSVEETNKLRAKLGLKPLKVTGKDSSSKQVKTDNEAADNAQNADFSHLEIIPGTDVRHKPADNLTEKLSADKLREKLKRKRQKRQQESKLLAVKSLADSSDEDASSWVKSQKQKQDEKELANKRAQMFEDLDDDFGIGDLVEADKKQTIKKESSYDSKALAGLKVQHSFERFQEGNDMVLTLKDADILDNDAMDTLVNVNVVDDERAEKNIIDIKKAKQVYNKFDVESVDEVTGEMEKKNILYKYDEEIEGVKRKEFVIGEEGKFNQEEADRKRREEIRKKLHGAKNEVSLNTGSLKLASDYLTQEEVAASKFKKVKKKKKAKLKMLKADDLIDQLQHENSQADHNIYETYVHMDTTPPPSMPIKDDVDSAKLSALQRTRDRLKKLKKNSGDDDIAERVLNITQNQPQGIQLYDNTGAEFIGTFSDDVATNSNIILNETSEFCRHLGAWRSSETSGMTESVSKEILEFEDSLKVDSTREFEKNNRLKETRGQWEEVTEYDGTLPMDLDDDGKSTEGIHNKANVTGSTILDEEPELRSGVAAALKVAQRKGYLSAQEKEQKSGNLKHLLAKNYSIDDKARDREEEGGRRGRDRDRDRGPSMPFQEKSTYVPNVKLEYVDDSGRLMNEKEAFRHLSHKFHGKGSGKVKTEKRMRKVMEESMMKNMSSTDTPLATLQKLKERQKESATPYVVLTGNKEQYEQIRR